MQKKKTKQKALPELALLPLQWTPQYPLPQAPHPPILFHPPVPPISVMSVFAAHSKKRGEKWQRSVSYVRGSHRTFFRDGMQHPSGTA